MGGQTSRMVREIVEDSMYIIRQTNRQKYEQSVAVHREVRSKIEELKRINEKMIHSAKQDAQRAELFETFQSVDAQKKSLDNVAEQFAKQFELPKSYMGIAERHREHVKKTRAETKEQETPSSRDGSL